MLKKITFLCIFTLLFYAVNLFSSTMIYNIYNRDGTIFHPVVYRKELLLSKTIIHEQNVIWIKNAYIINLINGKTVTQEFETLKMDKQGNVKEILFTYYGKNKTIGEIYPQELKNDIKLSETRYIFNGDKYSSTYKLIDAKGKETDRRQPWTKLKARVDIFDRFEEMIFLNNKFASVMKLIRTNRIKQAIGTKFVMASYNNNYKLRLWHGFIKSIKQEKLSIPYGKSSAYRITIKFKLPFFISFLAGISGKNPTVDIWLSAAGDKILKYNNQNMMMVLKEERK